jgi:hypothetical protein
LVFNSDESGDDMILRRTLEGAEKCALRDLRRLLDTVVEYFIVPHYERVGVRVRCRLKTFRATYSGEQVKSCSLHFPINNMRTHSHK